MERSHTPKGRRARDRILAAAERLIAVHGFHGTSMRDVAAAARLPLATTVYHFAKKEQLYAAVLAAIAADLEERVEEALASAGEHSSAALDALARAVVEWAMEEPGRVKLLLRELLDNPTRVARAARLPLAPFLERASALVAARGGIDSPEIPVLHVVGAISYFIAARPTVERIVGPKEAKRIDAAYKREALAFARRVLGVTGSATRQEEPHATRAATSAGPARPRASRAPHH
ncbi:MAG: CerR family C-terminal domain-containing protein [Deltaproteobacteria bacterium]|nr:CerR family C-terminal domain-containing protein [Deltaproteobacteria bacterium]